LNFPVYLNFFGHRVHPHMVLELVAYSAGFQLYLFTRRRWQRAAVPIEKNMWLIVGCVFGALFGSKVLALVESFNHYRPHLSDPRTWLGGKTIVGGLLGGWAGVEIAKKFLGIRHSTGDAFVYPLIVGMCIGRVGCFLTGLDDHTHGVHTSLPWAVNFGDGPRHPTQVYEIIFLLVLGVALLARSRASQRNGELFRLFMLGYLAFRFSIEFIKPRETPLMALSAIQIASILGVVYAVVLLARREKVGNA
jgi:phosphatidylglycerol:prolipoprotein diacylglycerol transferase